MPRRDRQISSATYLRYIAKAVEDGFARLVQTGPDEADTVPVPDLAILTNQLNTPTDDGILYQRCGGGRRVIRKRI